MITWTTSCSQAVHCRLAAISEHIKIDVTNLKLGKSIKVGDLNFEGLELINPKQSVVCFVKATRTFVETTETATADDRDRKSVV